MENPQYSIGTDVRRLLLVQFLKVIGLCILFYIGIVINLKLFNIEISSTLNILIIAIVLGLLIAQLAITYAKSLKPQYFFYADRIEFAGKNPKVIYFRDVSNVSSKRDLLDKLIGTGTIIIQPYFKIASINNSNQVTYYVEKLIENYRGYASQQPQQPQ